MLSISSTVTPVTSHLPSLLIHPSVSSTTIAHHSAAPSNSIPTAPSSSNLLPSALGNLKTRTIHLGDGTHVKFTANDVGPPPAISFTNKLPQLNHMWDDTSGYWDRNPVLVIEGVPIPIVYWKGVYAWLKSGGSLWKQGHWKRVKGSWCKWQVGRLIKDECLTMFLPFY